MKFRTHLVVAMLLSCALIGCSQDAGNPAGTQAASTTPVAFNVAGAPTVEISAPDMMCPESCAVKVKEILSKQPGAKEVVVDFDTKTAKVAVELDKFDADAAIASLVDHGFDHSTIKPSGDNSSGDSATANSPADEKPAG